MRRQLKDLSFEEAIETIETAHLTDPAGLYRIKRLVNGEFEEFDYAEVQHEVWTLAEIRCEEWIFEDLTPEVPEPQSRPEDNHRSFTRDDILSAVAAEVGQFYYKNPDSHKIAIGVVNRLWGLSA